MFTKRMISTDYIMSTEQCHHVYEIKSERRLRNQKDEVPKPQEASRNHKNVASKPMAGLQSFLRNDKKMPILVPCFPLCWVPPRFARKNGKALPCLGSSDYSKWSSNQWTFRGTVIMLGTPTLSHTLWAHLLNQILKRMSNDGCPTQWLECSFQS